MTLAQLLLYVMIGTPQERQDLKIRWASFCERNLIADDPTERDWPRGPWDRDDDEKGE